uniref:SFRICE_018669 n=1 Tax=Spodoptera frugiperda TaxID=7108 RepID=A0A2H1VQC8_SPOFR
MYEGRGSLNSGRVHIITSLAYKWTVLAKGRFSHREGLSINHHAGSMRDGDFKVITDLTMFNTEEYQAQESTLILRDKEGVIEPQSAVALAADAKDLITKISMFLLPKLKNTEIPGSVSLRQQKYK